MLFVLMLILISCSVSKNVSSNPDITESEFSDISVTVVFPDDVDTSSVFNHNDDDSTFYNTYLIQHLESGYYQELSYESSFDLWTVKDSSKIKIVDTLQHHVLFKNL